MAAGRLFLRCALLIAAALFPAAGTARAQDGTALSRPFAPWMALDGSLTDKRPQPSQEAIAAPRPTRNTTTGGQPPKDPVMTPDDTAELIDRLYNETGAHDMKPSPIEDSYAARIVDRLPQFGYDMFGRSVKPASPADKTALPAGAAQDDFLLSMGDRLDITFRGQRSDRKTYAIDSQGLLIVDDLPPLSAAGRTIGDVRAALEAEAAKLYNTEIFVALESVRQARVLIVGHVAHPGTQTLTVFNTALDALMAAGGVDKTGSLRRIRLVRDGRNTIVDLYALLVHGTTISDLSLRDGDRIVVPPIGPTVAIAGGVKRPGIYEILPDSDGETPAEEGRSQTLSAQDMLALAGGVLTPGRNRFLRMTPTADGRDDVTAITDTAKPTFSDGSILMVAPGAGARTGTVELAGHTRKPGPYGLDKTPTLSALIDGDKVFGPDIYPLIGIIERFDEDQLARQLIAFPPLLTVKGKFDRQLRDGDVVHLFSRTRIAALQKKNTNNPTETAYGSADTDDDEMDGDPSIESFLRERSAFVRGAVRAEGAWPVAEGVTLENLLAAAGGPTVEASLDDIEVTSRAGGHGTQRVDIGLKDGGAAAIPIVPGDSVRVKQKFNRVAENSVLIIGEVKNPGRYDIKAGDKMSDLLRRAGGLTEQAYPDGAIFSRDSERRAEEARFKAEAQELESRLAVALQKDEKDAPDETRIAMVQDLAAQLRNAEGVGRITVEADPEVLAVDPELDALLESGDRIYIPKRPLTVRVAGEVLSPAALQFRKNKDPRDYVMEAGGFTYDADTDRVFAVYPDGSAQPLAVGAWNHTPVKIPPGSTIIVPRDPKPFDFVQTARDVSQILSNLAITGIFIDDMRND